MPNVSAVNLSRLQQNKTDSPTDDLNNFHSAAGLVGLSKQANGPLRQQTRVENGETVRYLGVRTWSTYFFEKFIATRAEIAQAKRETQTAIAESVQPFLKYCSYARYCKPDNVVANLQSNVHGKSVLPAPVQALLDKADGWIGTLPNYRESSKFEAMIEEIRRIGSASSASFITTNSPLSLDGDVRLLTHETIHTLPKSNPGSCKTVTFEQLPVDFEKFNVDQYKSYYLSQLQRVAPSIKTSVVIELPRDAGKSCSKANVNGALEALREFTSVQSEKGEPVSFKLSVPIDYFENGNFAATAKDKSAQHTSSSTLIPD